jgi:Na+-driven multidrug efflux pump
MRENLSLLWEPTSTVLSALATNYINNIGNFYGTYLIAKGGLVPLAAWNAAFALQSVSVTPCSTTVGYFLNRTDVSLDDRNREYQNLKYERMHIRNLKRSWIGSFALSLLSYNLMLYGALLSSSLSQNSAATDQLKDYLKWFLPGLLPQLLLNGNRQFMVTMKKPWISTLFYLVYQGLDSALSYFLVEGLWKFPKGIAGLALANTLSISFTLTIFSIYIYHYYLARYPEKNIFGFWENKKYEYYAKLPISKFGQLKGLALDANQSLKISFEQEDKYNSLITLDSFREIAEQSNGSFIIWESNPARPNEIQFARVCGGINKKYVYHVMYHHDEFRLLIRRKSLIREMINKIKDYYSYGLRIAVDQGFLYYKSLLLNIVGVNQQAMQEACFQYIALLGNPIMYGVKDTADKLVDRAKKVSETAAKHRAYMMVMAVFFALCITLTFPLIFYRSALNLFLESNDKNNDQLLSLGLHLMLVNFPGVILNGVRDVSVAALSSFGNKSLPWWLIGVALVIGFPLAYVLGLPASMDAVGVMLSRTIVMAIGAALALWTLHRYEPRNIANNTLRILEPRQKEESGIFTRCMNCLPFFKKQPRTVTTEQSRLINDSFALRTSL